MDTQNRKSAKLLLTIAMLLLATPALAQTFDYASPTLVIGKTSTTITLLILSTLGVNTVAAWRLMGVGLLKLGEFAQAIGALKRAIEIDPHDAETKFFLGEALFHMGDVAAAAQNSEWVARNCDHGDAWYNLATVIPGDPEADQERVLDVRRAFAEQLARSQAADQPIADFTASDRKAGERIRVGYISAFFPNENYMKPVWELIRRHDRSRFQVYLFADNAEQDDFTWLGDHHDDSIHLTTALSNRQLIDEIRRQNLDVLVDLNAYSVQQRLPIYLHRLARHVAAWFNMYATSGLPGIDSIIGDAVVVREGEEGFFSERVVRLEQSYLSFDVNYETPDLVDPPIMKNGYLTFGSLVSQYKMTPQVYDAWSSILREARHARLVLGNRVLASKCNRQFVLDQFRRRDIAEDRISCLPPADHRNFLRYYDRIDVALDAFPYNGGTTTTESIWQGVPVLAINGDRWASRTSATLLKHCHLGEFAVESVQQYVASGVALAEDAETPARLGRLRREMRERLRESPVCQVGAMVADIENVFDDFAS